MIFTVGNLITLGIVALALILYRLADKNNRPLEKVKKYAEKCKEEIGAYKNEIAVYAEEKSMAVKNFGIVLDVERKAAQQLIKKLAEEELSKKSEAISRIEEQIQAFESSLEELFGMTDRVQENLNRIRDESAFVENTGRRISEAKEKFEQVERALAIAGKNLEETEVRLERKNAEVLEQTARGVITEAKSIVSDFEATTQVMERKVEDHKAALVKAEREREAILARDLELIKKTLRDVLENAGKRADKMEDAALVKLREQAQDRVNQVKSFFEEKIKSIQDTLRTEHVTLTEKLKAVNEKWNAEIMDISGKQKTFRQDFVKSSAELDSMAKKQREEIISALAKQQEEVTASLIKERDAINTSLVQQQTDWKENFLEFKKLTEKQRKDLDTSINEIRMRTQTELKQQHDELDTAIKLHRKEAGDTLSGLSSSLSAMQEQAKTVTKQQQDDIAFTISNIKEKSNAVIKQQQEDLTAAIKDIKEKSGIALRQQQEQLAASLKDIKEKSGAAVLNQQEELDATIKELKEKSSNAVLNQYDELTAALKKQMEDWKLLCRDKEQDIIAANEKRLEDYSKMQTEAVNQLNSLADDAGRLESELRLAMQEAVTRVKGDFAAFEKESGISMEKTAAAFAAQAQALQKDLKEMDDILNNIKQQAFENATEKLTIFEKDFTAELAKRTGEIGKQISEWQASLESKLESSAGKLSKDWQKAEERISTERESDIAALSQQITSDLERLKQEAAAFEKGIREEMQIAEETRSSFTEQIKRDLADMRITAESEVKTQVGEFQVSMQEILRQKQKELEKDIADISEKSKEAYSALDETAVKTRENYDEWQSSYNARMREMDDSLEIIRRQSRETAAENDERISQFRQNLDDIRKEMALQKKTFDKTGEVTQNLQRSIDEVNAELNKLEQRKNEITQVENQLTSTKRLVDEANSKMTRFLSEMHRIEVMEEKFKLLIKTEQQVKERLAHVESSDDILQAVQVQIRKLEDSIKETEEKYRRMEHKSDVIEQTNKGIDRNFKTLQETEAAIKNADKIINELADQFDNIRESIEALAKENLKAKEASEKITILDEALAKIEQRIEEMNVAREWLARTETELKNLDKDLQNQVKMAKGLSKKEGSKFSASEKDKGAPPPQDRDNIFRLREKGWTVEEIANAMNLGRGEVELILEIGNRG